MENAKKYIVVIGDVISSRKVENRSELQNKLLEAFNDLNPPGQDRHIISPFTITLGDEFQAVYDKADYLMLNAASILEKVYPQKIRFSFGIGKISTTINPRQSIGMDGSAFHNAREGITTLKEKRGSFNFILSGLDDPDLTKLYNHTLFMYSNLQNQWNKNRYTILRRTMDGVSVKEIAKDLELTETAIYRNIYDGSMRDFIAINECLTKLINGMLTS